jgi:hypothetical protein
LNNHIQAVMILRRNHGSGGHMQRALKILSSIILVRGLYALTLLTVISLYRLGWADPFEISGHLADLARAITPILTLVWAMYVIGYLVAGVMVWRANRLALWLYALAMSIDFSLWIYAASNISYELAMLGQARAIDGFFNVFDLAVLVTLVFLVQRQAIR